LVSRPRRRLIISPVLRALGWDVEDVEQVRHGVRCQWFRSPGGLRAAPVPRASAFRRGDVIRRELVRPKMGRAGRELGGRHGRQLGCAC
jgi:hypothetical protein